MTTSSRLLIRPAVFRRRFGLRPVRFRLVLGSVHYDPSGLGDCQREITLRNVSTGVSAAPP